MDDSTKRIIETNEELKSHIAELEAVYRLKTDDDPKAQRRYLLDRLNTLKRLIEKLPDSQSRDRHLADLLRVYRPFQIKFPDIHLPVLMQSRYGLNEVRLMTTEQLADFVTHLKGRLSHGA